MSLAETDAGEPARSERHERLPDLVADAGLVSLGLEEHEEALPSVRSARDVVIAERERGDRSDEQVADLRPGHEHHQAEDREDDHRSAEVGLCEDEQYDEPGHEHVRQEADREALDLLALLRERVSEVNDDRELRELPGLKADRAELDPPQRAVRAAADARHVHEAEHHDRDGEERVRVAAPSLDRRPKREGEEHEPDRDRSEVTHEVRTGLSARSRGADCARAVDHHCPEPDERDRCTGDPRIDAADDEALGGVGWNRNRGRCVHDRSSSLSFATSSLNKFPRAS
jgi:hypothetical protein